MDYYCKTTGMGTGICTGIWTPGSRRREVLHDYFLRFDVAVQILLMRGTDSWIWLWSYGSLDWNVRRLDGESSCIYIPVPQQKMDGTSGDLRGGKDKMTEWEKGR